MRCKLKVNIYLSIVRSLLFYLITHINTWDFTDNIYRQINTHPHPPPPHIPNSVNSWQIFSAICPQLLRFTDVALRNAKWRRKWIFAVLYPFIWVHLVTHLAGCPRGPDINNIYGIHDKQKLLRVTWLQKRVFLAQTISLPPMMSVISKQSLKNKECSYAGHLWGKYATNYFYERQNLFKNYY